MLSAGVGCRSTVEVFLVSAATGIDLAFGLVNVRMLGFVR
jgi:hypothetical protein